MSNPRMKYSDLTKAEYEMLLRECRFVEQLQEGEIFRLKCEGCSLVEIAFKTSLSVSTVTRRLSKIYKKIEKVIQP